MQRKIWLNLLGRSAVLILVNKLRPCLKIWSLVRKLLESLEKSRRKHKKKNHLLNFMSQFWVQIGLWERKILKLSFQSKWLIYTPILSIFINKSTGEKIFSSVHKWVHVWFLHKLDQTDQWNNLKFPNCKQLYFLTLMIKRNFRTKSYKKRLVWMSTIWMCNW